MLRHGFNIISYDTVESTNTELAKLYQANRAGLGAVLVAENQTGGRGRNGRQWQSLSGNLTLSMLIEGIGNPDIDPTLTCLAASALCKVIEALPGFIGKVSIKWPNDVLIDGQKVAGILAETVIHLQTQQAVVVLGVGLNIDQAPDDLTYPATTVNSHLPRQINKHDFLNIFLNRWLELYAMWSKDSNITLAAHWVPFVSGVGQRGCWQVAGQTREGVIQMFHADGSLRMKLDSGNECRIRMGEVLLN